MYKEKLGIVGGFGAFATLDFYKRILKVFASESERNYPHIIMDNNFTMPSRTRSLLFGEGYDEIVMQMAESLKLLLRSGVKWIVLVCGTAHYFLDDVYKLVPEAQEKVIDIINLCGEKFREEQVNEALIIAAECALQKRLYSDRLNKYGITCISPDEGHYADIRYFIECVKRDNMNYEMLLRFMEFLSRFNCKNVILGCTEFPVLAQYISESKLSIEQRKEWEMYTFYDPLDIVIFKLKEILR